MIYQEQCHALTFVAIDKYEVYDFLLNIAMNCPIYPGITIGNHSIVAPNSAVTKDVEPFTMVGGVSAKFIKSISLKD